MPTYCPSTLHAYFTLHTQHASGIVPCCRIVPLWPLGPSLKKNACFFVFFYSACCPGCETVGGSAARQGCRRTLGQGTSRWYGSRQGSCSSSKMSHCVRTCRLLPPPVAADALAPAPAAAAAPPPAAAAAPPPSAAAPPDAASPASGPQPGGQYSCSRKQPWAACQWDIPPDASTRSGTRAARLGAATQHTIPNARREAKPRTCPLRLMGGASSGTRQMRPSLMRHRLLAVRKAGGAAGAERRGWVPVPTRGWPARPGAGRGALHSPRVQRDWRSACKRCASALRLRGLATCGKASPVGVEVHVPARGQAGGRPIEGTQ